MGLLLLVGLATIPTRRLDAMPVLCPFRRATGLPCPTCGMTRSVSAALHGDLRASITHHPVGPAVLALVAVSLTDADRGARFADWLESRPAPLKLGAAAAVIAWWVARLRSTPRM